jgi:hypothetical protein
MERSFREVGRRAVTEKKSPGEKWFINKTQN